MRRSLKNCQRVQLKSEKEVEFFRKREERYIKGTPKIAVGALQNLVLQVWTEDLHKECLWQLKELNSGQRAFSYARTIVETCVALVPCYGYFIINQNMIFINEEKEVRIWINPNVLQHKVKIYLPPTPQGEKSMMRSIVSFLKLWLRCDFVKLEQSQHLKDLPCRLQPVKVKPFQRFKAQSPHDFHELEAQRRNSVNIYELKGKRRFQSTKFPLQQKKLSENMPFKFVRRPKSPGEESDKFRFLTFSTTNKSNNLRPQRLGSEEQLKNKTTMWSEKLEDSQFTFEHRTFTGDIHLNQTKTVVNQSLGLGSYFPNRTTANRNNHIVRMILQNDKEPNNFGKNNLLLDQQRLRQLEQEKLRKLKESLHGIGQQLNDLFQSALLEEVVSVGEIAKQFEGLLD